MVEKNKKKLKDKSHYHTPFEAFVIYIVPSIIILSLLIGLLLIESRINRIYIIIGALIAFAWQRKHAKGYGSATEHSKSSPVINSQNRVEFQKSWHEDD